jgi:hypothetical protein
MVMREKPKGKSDSKHILNFNPIILPAMTTGRKVYYSTSGKDCSYSDMLKDAQTWSIT